MPDNELFRLATAGELSQPEVLRAQTNRMLQDPRARALIDNFAGQWLQLRALESVRPDPDAFPGVDGALIADMITETKLMVADVFLKNRPVLDLLANNTTFVNESLARHYGLATAVNGPQFRRVELGERPGGLLTQGSILTLTSNPNRTSPVKRGKWIMENLLADEPPPPDPDVMPLEEQPQLTGTLRQQMEQHRADPNCASCHLTMDALGFSLENFDAVGRWREEDDGRPIDSNAVLEDGTPFSGADGLQWLLQNQLKQEFIRCFTEKLMTYALGRGIQYYDQCAIDQVLANAGDEFRFADLVVEITSSAPFRNRLGRPSGNAGKASERQP